MHATSDTYTIALAELGVSSGDELYIAAHAVVNNENNIIGYDCPTLDEIAAALPDQVQIVAGNYPNANSYFDVTVSGGTGLDGTYGAWCIDHTHTIYVGANYTANIYSSYEPLPHALTTGDDPNIDYPENLDLVNWVINQGFVGTYTSDDAQNATWNLIDDNPPTCNTNCQAIVDAAYANSEGYTPGFGDVVAVILQPVGTDGQTDGQVAIAQVTLLQLGLECTPIFQEETSWASAGGDAIPFKQGWGSYFIYTLSDATGS